MNTWTFDTAHSSIGFEVRHMMVAKVHGRFNEWSGSVKADPDNLDQTSIEVTIDTASIDTGQQKRDDHLRSADFFDAEKHPTLTFRSSDVKLSGDGEMKVTGELTMHGVTRTVTLDVEFAGPANDPWGNRRYGISASGKLNRKEFGLEWNQQLESGGVLVSDEVKLRIEGQIVEQAGEQSAAA